MEIAVESSPALCLYGPHASRMARLLRLRPSLIPRIVFGPARAMHAIGMFMYLAPEADGDDEQVASLIEQHHPRHLLRLAFPHAPEQCYRALDRAGDRVSDKSFYEILIKVAASTFSPLLFAGPMTSHRLNKLARLMSSDPLVAPLSDVLIDYDLLTSAETSIRWARALGVVHDDDDLGGATARTLYRRIMAIYERVPVPHLPIEMPRGLSQITSLAELFATGERFENCLRRRHGAHAVVGFLTGDVAYCVFNDQEVLIALHRVSDRVFHIGDQRGRKNEFVPHHRTQTLIDSLRLAGLTILESEPAVALYNLWNVASGPAQRLEAARLDLEGGL